METQNNSGSVKVECDYYGHISFGYVSQTDAKKCGRCTLEKVWVGDHSDLGNGNFWPAAACKVVK